MILKWVPDDRAQASRDVQPLHRGGYWVAETDDGGNDGVGADPLTAVSNLVAQIEREAKR